MWEVMRRVLADGGEINDGDALDKALQTNLTVVSVYGGDESTVGTYTLDPTTHSVIKREMGVFEYKGGTRHPEGVLRHRRRGLSPGLRHPDRWGPRRPHRPFRRPHELKGSHIRDLGSRRRRRSAN